MSFFNIIAAILAVQLLLLGCATKTDPIRLLKDTELHLPHLPGEGRVDGKDCSYRFLYFSLSGPRIDLAIQNALRKRAQQYNALADAEIVHSSKPFLFSLLGSKECLIVIGRPVLLVKPPAPDGISAMLDR